MFWRIPLLVLPAVGLGCLPTGELALPALGPATKSFVLMLECDGRPRFEAFDAEQQVDGLPWACVEPGRAVLLEYQQSLDGFDLQPGVVFEAPTKACLRYSLPRADRMFGADLSEASSMFAPIENAPDVVESFRYHGPCRCGFDTTTLTLDVVSFHGAAVVTGPFSAIVVRDRTLYELEAHNGSLERISTSTVPFEVSSGYQHSSGETWLGARPRAILHGSLNSGFERIDAPDTSTQAVNALDGPRDSAASFELFTMQEAVAKTHTSVFATYRHRDQQSEWEVLKVAPFGSRSTQPERVVWLGPGSALGLEADQVGPVWWDSGRLTQEPWPVTQTPSTLDFVEGFGAVIASEGGTFRQFREESWVDIGDTPSPAKYIAIAQFGDGFIAIADKGSVTRYNRRAGFCGEVPVLSPLYTYYWAVALAEGVLVGTRKLDRDSQPDAPVLFLSPATFD